MLTKIHIIYGFYTKVELTNKDEEELYNNGLISSPVCYSTDDTPSAYIVGKLLQSIGASGQHIELKEITEQQKNELKNEIFSKLSTMSFDPPDSEYKIIVNTYYY